MSHINHPTHKLPPQKKTTENACATVALLNIIMNSPEIDLGDKLREFKESTKDLCTQLRGYQLGNNSFIRTIHNSFTRRMDHLNADLCLENEVSDSGSKKAKKRATPKKGRKTSTKKKVSNDYGFHFIAYVPASGHVWELDGLRDKPHRLGKRCLLGNILFAASAYCLARCYKFKRLDRRCSASD